VLGLALATVACGAGAPGGSGSARTHADAPGAGPAGWSPTWTPTPAHHAQPPPSPASRRTGVPPADLPRKALTPGAALEVGVARICTPGYASSVRDVSDAEKARVYARYHVAWVPYQHEVDHLISLELGGSNAVVNLWPEPYVGRWGARTKDVLENRLHDLVCSGRLALAAAQHQEAADWVGAYRRYVGTAPGAGGSGGGSGGGSSSGGYYASSYPGAATIYCADDPAWRSLSKTYLVHVDTWAQAMARFPGYHLHRSC
jgi:hypothetical protein